MSDLKDQSKFGMTKSYKLSPDELRVIKECNYESILQRGVPFGTGFGLAAYYFVQNGFLRTNPHYGAVPKVTMAIILGYFIGKISYQQNCVEKLMGLPDSYMGQWLRDNREAKYKVDTGCAPLPRDEPTTSPSQKRTNKYGDDIE